jgi:predicted nucleotidyltransferase
MSKKFKYSLIRQTVDAFIPGSRILLFGSQARGDYDNASDYDLLIITNQKYSVKEKIHWLGILNRSLVNAIDAPFDVLMDSEEEIFLKGQLPGHIIQTALKEGVAI